MTQAESRAVLETGAFAPEQVAQWRRQVSEQREMLFHRNWKNRRSAVELRSKQQEDSFRFVVEWYEEFSDVVGRERERNRLDNLIDLGLDVNDPANQHIRP